MMSILIDEGIVTPYERRCLSLTQILILACIRRLGSKQQVARFLGKDEQAIGMILFRIKAKGFSIMDEKIYAGDARQKLSQEEGARRTKARGAVSYAIKTGKLIRGTCETCGTDANIEAHHDDYSKPLDVRWFCRKHHPKTNHD